MLWANKKTTLALLVVALAAATVTSVMAASKPTPTPAEAASADEKIAVGASLDPAGVPPGSRDGVAAAAGHAGMFLASWDSGVEGSGSSAPWFANGSPNAGPGDPSGSSEPGSPDDQWMAEQAQETVAGNAQELRSLCGGIARELLEGDISAVSLTYAPDETVTAALGTGWPQIESITSLGTVNVFQKDETLVYFTYALVRWTDAGVSSERTVCIPLRFVNGTWYLTTIDDTTDGLVFVTSASL